MEKMMKKMFCTVLIGGIGYAGYLYLVNNDEAMKKMKKMTKKALKNAEEKLDEMD